MENLQLLLVFRDKYLYSLNAKYSHIHWHTYTFYYKKWQHFSKEGTSCQIVLLVWDTWCSPSGCADTPVSGPEGENFCPAESGSSGRNPTTMNQGDCQRGICANDGDWNNVTTACQKNSKTLQWSKLPPIPTPRQIKVALNQNYWYVSISLVINVLDFSEVRLFLSRRLPRRVSAAHCCRGLRQRTSVPCTEYADCSGVYGPSHPPGVSWPPVVLPGKNCTNTIVTRTSRSKSALSETCNKSRHDEWGRSEI